jgi:EF-P beta-lysylation protein EpmB
VQTPDWQQALNQGFSDMASLLQFLRLDPKQGQNAIQAQQHFNLRVPREYAALMRKGDPEDPLLRQVLPSGEELDKVPGFVNDPVAERAAEKIPGLLQKYHGRVLIMTTGACAIHCRYCFRRHYPYSKGTATPTQWRKVMDYLQQHPQIEEVILSGGDPLMISDHRLQTWLDQLQALVHLKRIRLHSRLPVVLPQRITPAFVQLLGQCRLPVVLVLHTNHPTELTIATAMACQQLKHAGITLLNQSVLLRGVNDNIDTLVTLSKRLFEIGVLPYYLHLLDSVAGAAHFESSRLTHKQLKQQLQSRLPGYLVPKIVQEIAGEPSKIPL